MLHLTLRQLKVFESVAKCRSFSRAAEALHLSQPAVSMQVKQLEESVGLPLFEQMGKKIFLTEAGQEMFRYSRAIAEQLEEMEGVLARLKGLGQGQLKLTVVSTANYFALQLLASFCQRHTGVTVSLDVTNREVLLQQLSSNETDMAIMGLPPEGHDLGAESFMENPLVVIASPGHALAGVRQIKLQDLERETFLVRESGSGTRSAMERFFQEHGIAYKTGMVMSTNEAIKQAVQAGMGLGIVSLHTVALELETGRLAVLDVESFPIMRHWFVVHRQDKRLSPVAAGFKAFLLEEAAALMPGNQASPLSSMPSS
ncbi:MAG: LysR family transcriptional regulator [Sulfurimicrobium sp.]|jgi:DNA-binding transcriptional LysR family regulator|nr:LysR family transcriptional regulator [Sulfurimicrobium sp.]MDO9189385.1 LysR family transcriptional regulator [Sulfurimicrobium sp.]MDP1704399.1 LysR family transcriptional regulator [Sulfurimicrobium sp.]MDP2199717.1 LysR family transcriptional regulator [Sulfurimicrobium sp.]MDP2962301.1 LysR family transcriptional regulator [Sulfurimicrobium sp.]